MATNASAHKILIVDDMPVNSMILSSLLEARGMSVETALSGEECLEFCGKRDYDLIFLDQHMPGMDGIDTLIGLKECFKEKGKETPVICHTTAEALPYLKIYKAAGFAGILTKPVVPAQLSELLKACFHDESPEELREERDEQQRIEEQIKLLPAWLENVPDIDVRTGIENCETAENYLKALDVFEASISEKASQIEEFLENEDWEMYTLRVHSIKSTARLIGANGFSELAAELEYAGKEGKTAFLAERTPEFIKEYRSFDGYFARLKEQKKAEAGTGEKKCGAAPREMLEDAYGAIKDFVESYDVDSIQMLLTTLEDYMLEDGDRAFFESVSKALADSDWDRMRQIVGV
ncbi:MAG: response regulator [Lachnospiraceae bacterium]|nr:response regulator [Lachnospiraceae bacterium]